MNEANQRKPLVALGLFLAALGCAALSIFVFISAIWLPAGSTLISSWATLLALSSAAGVFSLSMSVLFLLSKRPRILFVLPVTFAILSSVLVLAFVDTNRSTVGDADQDGVSDSDEAYWGLNFGADIDGDGKENYLDTDSDGDGIEDGDEPPPGPTDKNKDTLPAFLDPSR